MSERPADPCAIVIFGAGGDLTKRKLVPALYNLRCHGLLPAEFSIVGIGRAELTHDTFREQMGRDIREFATIAVDAATWKEFEDRLYFLKAEFDDDASYRDLGTLLAEAQKKHGTAGNALFYLATPPAAFATIAKRLAAAGLTREDPGCFRRVIVEKPFGRDLDSARALNAELQAALGEHQIYRIDHYLGK